MVFIGIDFGDRRVGLARSDGVLATAVCAVRVNGIADAARKCADKIKELCGETVVIGLPRNMDSTEGFRAVRTRRFGDMLAELTGITPEYFDERLTTVRAHAFMNDADLAPGRKKGMVDSLSAEIILQDYLDSLKNTSK